MNNVASDVWIHAPIIPSLRNIRYANAVKNTKNHIRERASGVILSDFNEEDFSFYQEIEKRKLHEIFEILSTTLVDDAYQAIFEYVSARHSEFIGDFFDEDGADFFDTFSINMRSKPTTIDDCTQKSSGKIIDKLASFYFSPDKKNRIIDIFLNEVFFVYPEKMISEQGLLDILFQILLHEMLHAMSANSYMTSEEEVAARRAIIVKEAINWPDLRVLKSQDITSNIGYSLIFVWNENMEFRWYPTFNSLNEALTDIIAARIYTKFSREKYGQARRYFLTYQEEAYNFHTALREFCEESSLNENEVFHKMENGYFFLDDGENFVMRDIISPFLKYYNPGSRFQGKESDIQIHMA